MWIFELHYRKYAGFAETGTRRPEAVLGARGDTCFIAEMEP